MSNWHSLIVSSGTCFACVTRSWVAEAEGQGVRGTVSGSRVASGTFREKAFKSR